MFFLFFVIVYVVLAMVSGGLGAMTGSDSGFGFTGILLLLFILGSFIPMLAVQVRRFHDQDKSGWFVLLSFIPFVGGLIVLVFMCLEGTKGENQYGPDPSGVNPNVFE
ncbi:MAG: DUF805 domain-containing protein [Sphingomonadaceae bacterium]